MDTDSFTLTISKSLSLFTILIFFLIALLLILAFFYTCKHYNQTLELLRCSISMKPESVSISARRRRIQNQNQKEQERDWDIEMELPEFPILVMPGRIITTEEVDSEYSDAPPSYEELSGSQS